MASASLPRYSPSEYLAIDRAAETKNEYAAETKNEYFDGELHAMSGSTLVHALLTARMTTELNIALAGKGCLVASSDVRVRATASTYVYPDVSVICGKPRVLEEDILLNPAVIVEVLSDSTERYDRGIKFARYQRLEFLHEYVLLSQSEPRVEVFDRVAAGEWSMHVHESLSSVAKLESLGIEIPLQKLCQDVPV